MTAFSEYLFLVQFGPAVLKSVAVLAVDLSDDEMKIVYASELLEQMFGYGPGEMQGKSMEMLLREEDRELHREHFRRFRKAPATRSMNRGVWVDAVRKDGTGFKIMVSLCVQPVGRMDCVIACVADVTPVYLHYKPQEVSH